MNQFEQLLDSILTDELAAARTASDAIAYVGSDVPADLLLASGRFVCHLPWNADRRTPVADRWLEPSFAPWARSMLEDWAAGRFDFLNCVIFSRGDDSVQRLYYYVCELQRRGLIGGPDPLILDVARVGRASSILRSIAAVRQLAVRMDIENDALEQGIREVNRRRRLFAAIAAQRGRNGRLYERIARASLFADIHAELSQASLPAGEPRRSALLAGTAPPDDRLHEAVEAVGWDVTGECHDRSLDRLGEEVSPEGRDPAARIGVAMHKSSLGARSFVDRAATVVEASQRACADAVVLWLTEQDEAMSWCVPAQRAALAAAGIPVYVASRRLWDASDGIDVEIADFLQGLES